VYLDALERSRLCIAYPIMVDYDKLWLSAVPESIAILRENRPPVDGFPIDKNRSWLMGVSLLRFNFIYGDLVRWLGGEYTNSFRSGVANGMITIPRSPPNTMQFTIHYRQKRRPASISFFLVSYATSIPAFICLRFLLFGEKVKVVLRPWTRLPHLPPRP
jgi:hypothetical protein